MARKPRPWYWEQRGIWCVTINAERHNLGSDEAEAERLFHELMARPKVRAPPKVEGPLVVTLCDRYLDWCQKHRAESTYTWYLGYIQKFLDWVEDVESLTVETIKPYHVVNWVDENPDWTDNARRGAIIAIQRPLNWSEKMGYIEKNPIRHIEKPQPTRREGHITPEQWAKIRDHYPEGDPFRGLLTFLWETGCRPFEARMLEARHVDLDRMMCVIPPKEAKGKKRWRVIHLNAVAAGILKERLAAVPDGVLFLNAKNRPWTAYAINCRFERLKKHVDQKFCSYLLRHGFATKKLTDGVDPLTVSELMGHADGTMLAKVYSHLCDRHDHLKAAINRDASASDA